MKRSCLLLTLAVGILVLAGCESNGVYFEDDIKEEFDFRLDSHPDNKMHLPYAVGANVKISIYPDDSNTSINYEAFFESADPGIAQILDDTGEYRSDGGSLSVKIETKSAGKT